MPSALHIVGTVNGQPYSETLDFGSAHQFQIDARGGRGGDGGNGGSGAEGKRGSDGSDATSTWSGTDGESGGPGGDGGNATSGGSGGNGGVVQIIVSEDDMDLLMMMGSILVDGGLGGKAGRNGSGGKGGRGGSGGSSYSWTTTTTSYSTDTDGNTTSSDTTHYHSNSGGLNGSDGSPGKPGNAYTTAGQDGVRGSYEYIVEHKTGPLKYFDKYDIKLEDFEYRFPEDDGVVEPGERGLITSITLHNQGLMPTPVNQDFLMSIVDTPLIKGLNPLPIPRSIPP